MIYHIKYKGDNVYDGVGQIRLKSDSFYRIDFGWSENLEMNGWWVFYIYDEIGKNTNESFGFELEIKNIESTRQYNLKMLLQSGET